MQPDTVRPVRPSACSWQPLRTAGSRFRLLTRGQGSRRQSMSASLTVSTVETTPAAPRERASGSPSAGPWPAAMEATCSCVASREMAAPSSSDCPLYRPRYAAPHPFLNPLGVDLPPLSGRPLTAAEWLPEPLAV